MMVRNGFCLCKRLNVEAPGRPLVRRSIRRGALNPIRLTLHLIVLFAWRCICRTSHLPRRTQRKANMAPTAKGQMLALLR